MLVDKHLKNGLGNSAQIAGVYIQTFQPLFLCSCQGPHPQCRLLQKYVLLTLRPTLTLAATTLNASWLETRRGKEM